MDLIEEIEDLIEYFDSKSGTKYASENNNYSIFTSRFISGSSDNLTDLFNQLRNASKKAKNQDKEESSDPSDIKQSSKNEDLSNLDDDFNLSTIKKTDKQDQEIKRPRGRPRKNPEAQTKVEHTTEDKPEVATTKRPRGRPRKNPEISNLPVNVDSKIDKKVKVGNIKEVKEFYSKLIDFKEKITSLFKLDDEELDEIKEKAINSYADALEKLKEIAEGTFPVQLEYLAKKCQESLIDSLSEQTEEGTNYFFNEDKATFSRFVKADEDSLVYSYKIILREVKDDEEFAFPEYVVIISQKISPDESKADFYITRLLKNSVSYNLGREFSNEKEMIKNLNSILNYDQIRSEVSKVAIPFKEEELTERFIDDVVKSVSIDSEDHKIVIEFKPKTTRQEIEQIIPDFISNLSEIVNQKTIAIKYNIKYNSSNSSVEFILVKKVNSKGELDREQLIDMKERYNLSNETYRNLLKFFTVGN